MIFWIIQFLPLVSAAAILLFLRRNHAAATGVSVIAALANALLAFAAFRQGAIPPQRPAVWMEVGLFQAEFGFVFDHLAQLMLLVVTGVGALIHVFSATAVAAAREWRTLIFRFVVGVAKLTPFPLCRCWAL
jgi:NADH-quinone oxidoreductase subunit L